MAQVNEEFLYKTHINMSNTIASLFMYQQTFYWWWMIWIWRHCCHKTVSYTVNSVPIRNSFKDFIKMSFIFCIYTNIHHTHRHTRTYDGAYRDTRTHMHAHTHTGQSAINTQPKKYTFSESIPIKFIVYATATPNYQTQW